MKATYTALYCCCYLRFSPSTQFIVDCVYTGAATVLYCNIYR